MDTAEQNGTYQPMSVEEFNTLRRPPEISSMEGAIAFVTGIIENLRVWPEKIEVLDPAEIKGELTLGYGGREYAAALAKIQAVRWKVRDVIKRRHAEPMMPELALKSDSGVVAYIWDKEIYRVA